jgi:hypothetical protein
MAQSPKVPNNGNTLPGVTLSLLSQRCLPKNKVPYMGDDFIDFSDMTTRFRLSNRSSKDVYYLADGVTSTADPVGFELFRPNKRSDWEAPNTPARDAQRFSLAKVSTGCCCDPAQSSNLKP